MTRRTKKILGHVFRFGICTVALWFVLRHVTLDDHLSLRSGGTVAGAVEDAGDAFVVRLLDGREQRVPKDDVRRPHRSDVVSSGHCQC